MKSKPDGFWRPRYSWNARNDGIKDRLWRRKIRGEYVVGAFVTKIFIKKISEKIGISAIRKKTEN